MKNKLLSPLPKPSRANVAWMSICIVPQLLCCVLWVMAITDSPLRFIPTICIFSYLLLPCCDRHYGNGRKFHYARQGIFIAFGLLALEINLL